MNPSPRQSLRSGARVSEGPGLAGTRNRRVEHVHQIQRHTDAVAQNVLALDQHVAEIHADAVENAPGLGDWASAAVASRSPGSAGMAASAPSTRRRLTQIDRCGRSATRVARPN